jgi:hypothetical protein
MASPLSRRSALGAGFGQLALAGLMHAEGRTTTRPNRSERAGRTAGQPTIDPLEPLRPRPPALKATAQSVIFLFQVGGPSHLDTFERKPKLDRLDGQKVPDSIRKAVEASRHANVFHGCEPKLMASPFRWARHGRMGIEVSELFPHLARHVDDLCFLHGMQADSNNHAPASYQLHTGEIRPGKASLGSWVTYGLGSENRDLPGFVTLFDAGPLGGAANYSNGFLPAAFQPTRLRDRNPSVLDVTPPDELAAGQRETLDAVRELNLRHRADRVGVTELDARIAAWELAYRLQSSALEVADLEREPAWLRAEYGFDHPDERTRAYARKCLLTRRLIERGVRFVQLYDMPDKDGWDAHAKLVDNHRPRARWTDQPTAALLADLKRRGLLESTLVVWGSEFGRTPMMQGDHGRQHNAAGFTMWLAGGGVKPGQRIGATDEIGLMAVDRPTPIRDLHATILRALGIPHEDLFFEVGGRQERLTGVAGSAKPIAGVLG